MSATSSNRSQLVVRLGGWSLIAATVLFAAVFTFLAQRFDYPDVLDRSAAEVLPRLLALGSTGRAVWVLYGMVPFLLIPTALGVASAAGGASPRAVQGATIAAVLSALCMSLGLLRWPSLQWTLAAAYGAASPALRDAIEVSFAAANSYLGNYIGEFLGELFLNTFFLLASYALGRAAAPSRRWLWPAGLMVTGLGSLAMLRNVTALVGPAAAVNNAVLPLWMLVLGIALLMHPAPARSQV